MRALSLAFDFQPVPNEAAHHIPEQTGGLTRGAAESPLRCRACPVLLSRGCLQKPIVRGDPRLCGSGPADSAVIRAGSSCSRHRHCDNCPCSGPSAARSLFSHHTSHFHLAAAVTVCQSVRPNAQQDTRSGRPVVVLTGLQVAQSVGWGHLCPVAGCRDKLGSVVVALGGGHPCTPSSALCSAGDWSDRGLCGGSGDRRSLPDGRVAAHFHLDRGISISA